MTVFPNSFLWGTSTAGHQIEGGNTNTDFWLLEHLAKTPFAEPSGEAIDFRHHWKSDIALMAALGYGAFRFSIEWSRIEPEEGRFDSTALDYYRDICLTLREAELVPVITFNHFTLPLWLARTGGWLRTDAPDLFARYCRKVHDVLGDFIGLACTLNEPNIIAHGAVVGRKSGTGPATDTALLSRAAKAAGSDRFYSFFFVDGIEARPNLIKAHRRAVEGLKEAGAHYRIGLALNLRDYQLIEDTKAAQDWHQAFVREGHDMFYDACKGDDFIGVQNYSRRSIGSDGVLPVPEGARLTQMGVEDYPQGLGNVIRQAAARSGCPVYVTENGLPTDDDERRISFINAAVKQVRDCLSDGIDVRGYFYWSTWDNYEWLSGYSPKFGLISVDRNDFSRRPKPSAEHFGAIIRANGTLQKTQ